MRRSITLTSLSMLLWACGADPSEMTVEHIDFAQREARVRLSPALDFANLFDASLADRIAIQEIVVNIADVRLSATAPDVAPEELSLLQGETMISSNSGALVLPFPRELATWDLAVRVELAPSPALEGASVVVRGLLYKQSGTSVVVRALAVDPDGEPADKGGEENVDPDGEPADRGGEQNVDPDGEPADCALEGIRCATLRSDDSLYEASSFELRDTEAVNLLMGFGTATRIDVVFAIPAARWLTPETVAEIERQAARSPQDLLSEQGPGQDDTVVIEDDHRASSVGRTSGEPLENGGDLTDDYRLHRGEEVDPSRIRQR